MEFGIALACSYNNMCIIYLFPLIIEWNGNRMMRICSARAATIACRSINNMQTSEPSESRQQSVADNARQMLSLFSFFSFRSPMSSSQFPTSVLLIKRKPVCYLMNGHYFFIMLYRYVRTYGWISHARRPCACVAFSVALVILVGISPALSCVLPACLV